MFDERTPRDEFSSRSEALDKNLADLKGEGLDMTKQRMVTAAVVDLLSWGDEQAISTCDQKLKESVSEARINESERQAILRDALNQWVRRTNRVKSILMNDQYEPRADLDSVFKSAPELVPIALEELRKELQMKIAEVENNLSMLMGQLEKFDEQV